MSERITDASVKRSACYGKRLNWEKEESPSGQRPQAMFDNNLTQVSRSNIIVITDAGDADGITCAALYRHEDDSALVMPAGYRGISYDPIKGLKLVKFEQPSDADIYITDLGQNAENESEWVKLISDLSTDNRVHIRDHHDNSEDVVSELNQMDNVDYIHNTDVCASKIVYNNDISEKNEKLSTLVDYVNVRDMYDQDSPIFEAAEIISDAAKWLPIETYIDVVLENGVNLENNSEFGEFLRKKQELKRKKIKWVLENTVSLHEVCGFTVAVGFGSCDVSKIGAKLYNSKVDIVAIINPKGSLGLRSSEEAPFAVNIAEEFDGGGHPQAAGAKPFDSISVSNSEIHEKRFDVLSTAEKALSHV